MSIFAAYTKAECGQIFVVVYINDTFAYALAEMMTAIKEHVFISRAVPCSHYAFTLLQIYGASVVHIL